MIYRKIKHYKVVLVILFIHYLCLYCKFLSNFNMFNHMDQLNDPYLYIQLIVNNVNVYTVHIPVLLASDICHFY